MDTKIPVPRFSDPPSLCCPQCGAIPLANDDETIICERCNAAAPRDAAEATARRMAALGLVVLRDPASKQIAIRGPGRSLEITITPDAVVFESMGNRVLFPELPASIGSLVATFARAIVAEVFDERVAAFPSGEDALRAMVVMRAAVRQAIAVCQTCADGKSSSCLPKMLSDLRAIVGDSDDGAATAWANKLLEERERARRAESEVIGRAAYLVGARTSTLREALDALDTALREAEHQGRLAREALQKEKAARAEDAEDRRAMVEAHVADRAALRVRLTESESTATRLGRDLTAQSLAVERLEAARESDAKAIESLRVQLGQAAAMAGSYAALVGSTEAPPCDDPGARAAFDAAFHAARRAVAASDLLARAGRFLRDLLRLS